MSNYQDYSYNSILRHISLLKFSQTSIMVQQLQAYWYSFKGGWVILEKDW